MLLRQAPKNIRYRQTKESEKKIRSNTEYIKVDIPNKTKISKNK